MKNLFRLNTMLSLLLFLCSFFDNPVMLRVLYTVPIVFSVFCSDVYYGSKSPINLERRSKNNEKWDSSVFCLWI